MKTDDAELDGLVAGPRARLDHATIDEIAGRYGLGRVLAVRDLGGSYNLNLALTTTSGVAVLRVHRPWVTPDRLALLQRLRADLVAAGLPAVVPIADRAGDRVIRIGDRLAEVEPYVAHDGEADSWARYRTGLALLGALHDALRVWSVGDRWVPPRVANYREPAALIPWIRRTTERIEAARRNGTVASAEADRAQRICATALAALEAIEPWWQGAKTRLPRQPIHGDYGGGNLLFAGETVRAVVDFDFLAVRERVFDPAYALFWALRRLEGDRSPATHSWDRLADLLAAYDAGTARPLTADERAAMPLEMARVPLYWAGETWLTENPVGSVLAQAPAVETAAWVLRHRGVVDRALRG